MPGILKEYEERYMVVANNWPKITDEEADAIAKLKMGVARVIRFPNSKKIDEYMSKLARKCNSFTL